ncbi:MAG: ribonucleoside-diphosphate reductase 1 alpha chain [Candidatus Scalindua rubra]|uniref:Vitamin B12-dependent ribonucleotide reductase n=1 Tax=Candidatus Scalindua rubra TaxID=1872076 RepID=A0A1E3XCN7_9BACT|nr:MAG: ribonucleoside-diphosphate reductase 1 alpha chain [Candidatus Scalindua rubra]
MSKKLSTNSSKIKISPKSKIVLEERYLKKNEFGEIVETPMEMFRRIARNIASADTIYNNGVDIKAIEDQFYDLMLNSEFLPNSPALMNAGREFQQLAACFVLPIEDSIESIFDTVKYAALIHQSGGGTGFSFSNIRPKDDVVSTSGGKASGPISFMKVFNEATESINQGGFRRGANMAVLRVNHPDILDFISAKNQEGNLINFNISVAITDEFMKALEKNKKYPLVNPRTGKVVKQLYAKDVFDKLVYAAWKNGEPGMIFLDKINDSNPTPNIGKIEGTNPCGEQPLLPFESCVLGSINLAKMLLQDGNTYKINWEKLSDTIKISVHFLDNIIDVNRFPLNEISRMTKNNRKIGLGVMGFADMLIKMGIPYNSIDALNIADKLMEFFSKEANLSSARLAEERGAFPNFEKSKLNKPDSLKFRNATRTTIAPTGTLSIIANCSSGIEPLFALSYVHHILGNKNISGLHPLFEAAAKEKGFYSSTLVKEISMKGTIRDIKSIPEEIKEVFVTAKDISPEWHIKMQATFQKYIDNAVSKTINFSQDTTKEDVERAFLLAYKGGCKGITVYRDKSRMSQALSIECACEEIL